MVLKPCCIRGNQQGKCRNSCVLKVMCLACFYATILFQSHVSQKRKVLHFSIFSTLWMVWPFVLKLATMYRLPSEFNYWFIELFKVKINCFYWVLGIHFCQWFLDSINKYIWFHSNALKLYLIIYTNFK